MMPATIRPVLIVAALALAGCATAGSGDRNDRTAAAPACPDGGIPTCLETLGHRTSCFCADKKSMRDLLEPKPRQFR